MRVLLTRAAEDAARTKASLEALGHRVVVSPVIAIEALNAPWPSGVVDAVLATSGHAFLALADGRGPIREARRLIPLWLVGGRTEVAARANGFEGAAFVAPNAVALAFEMGKRRERNRMVYLAGRDRKPDLEMALKVTEQTVEVSEIYEARATNALSPAAIRLIDSGTLDAVLHFSRRSATLFKELVLRTGLSLNATHLCLSTDVSEPLAAEGWRTIVSDRPTESALLGALERLAPT